MVGKVVEKAEVALEEVIEGEETVEVMEAAVTGMEVMEVD